MKRTDMSRRAKRRAEARKNRMEAKGQFHPRSLARSVAHGRLAYTDYEQINKVRPGAVKSTFAMKWREVAGQMAR